MNQENSQLDISGIQLRDPKTPPKVSHSREIGEAQIVQTIFGRAKVRITRKGDNFRRALWRMTVVALAAIAFVVWQGWYANRQTAAPQSADTVPPVSATLQERAPVSQTENIVTPAMPPAVAVEPHKPAPVELSKPVINQNNAAHAPAAIRTAEKEVTKPVVAQPKPAVIPHRPVAIQPNPIADLPKPVLAQPKPAAAPEQPAVPQTQAVGASNNGAGNNIVKPQTTVPPAAKPPLPKQAVVPAVAAPPALKMVAPASSPVAVPALAAPLVKEDAPALPPATDKSLAAPLNSPGK